MVCKAFGLVGGVVVLVSFTFIGMFLVMNISLRQFVQWLAKSAKIGFTAVVKAVSRVTAGIGSLVKSWAHRQPRPNLNRKNRRLPFTIIKARLSTWWKSRRGQCPCRPPLRNRFRKSLLSPSWLWMKMIPMNWRKPINCRP